MRLRLREVGDLLAVTQQVRWGLGMQSLCPGILPCCLELPTTEQWYTEGLPKPLLPGPQPGFRGPRGRYAGSGPIAHPAVPLLSRCGQSGLHPLQQPGPLLVHRECHSEAGGGSRYRWPRRRLPRGELAGHCSVHQQGVQSCLSHGPCHLHRGPPGGELRRPHPPWGSHHLPCPQAVHSPYCAFTHPKSKLQPLPGAPVQPPPQQLGPFAPRDPTLPPGAPGAFLMLVTIPIAGFGGWNGTPWI